MVIGPRKTSCITDQRIAATKRRRIRTLEMHKRE